METKLFRYGNGEKMETLKEVKMVEWFDSRFYKIQYEQNQAEVTEYFASTTTKLGIIAKPFLAQWRGDIGNREADMRVFESSERGIRIHHAWCTLATNGIVLYQPFGHPNYSNEEISAIQEANLGNVSIIRYQDEMYDIYKLSRWLKIVKPKILFSEKIVYSVKHKDAGTLDNLMLIEEGKYQINGKEPLCLPKGLYVVDLKTGNVVDDNAFMQTADYAFCVEEMGLGEVSGTLILHTGSKTRTGIEGLATLYRSKEETGKDYEDYRLAAALWERKNADMKPKVFEFPSLLTLKENQNES